MKRLHCAIVVIGRNEGERLRKCLESATASAMAVNVVYVDSGSTDNSLALAKSFGCETVELDLSVTFTAARARNEGFKRALQLDSSVKYVQFVDGDCEFAPGWLSVAVDFLEEHPGAAAACGRRRERHPEHSIFNQLCDIEWNTNVGQAKYCGGDVMIRADALRAVNGYRPDLIAGEEPELCVRLRANGWTIWRIEHEMTLHDAAITRIGQWWNRSKRAGYAFTQGASLHGAPPERHFTKEARSALIWGAGIPLIVALLAMWNIASLFLFFIYPLQILRIFISSELKSPLAWIHASFLVLGKFPEAQGAIKFLANNVLQKPASLIEYK